MLYVYLCQQTADMHKVSKGIVMHTPLLLLTEETIKAAKTTDIKHNYIQRETSVNFPHTEPVCD